MKYKYYKEIEKYFFDREVLSSEDSFERKWFFHEDDDEEKIDDKDILLFSLHAFNKIKSLLTKYSAVNICLGLECITTQSCNDYCYSFINENIDENLRIKSIKSFGKVFSLFFNKYCFNEMFNTIDDITKYRCNFTCYMWWDSFPWYGMTYKESMVKTDETIIELLQFILNLDNIACKESALYGIGNWHSGYPEKVEEIVANSINNLPHELHDYAKKAMYGYVF